jgi:hypothetical protein
VTSRIGEPGLSHPRKAVDFRHCQTMIAVDAIRRMSPAEQNQPPVRAGKIRR